MPAGYRELLAGDPSPDVFVRQALRLLEADHRELALLALADWEQLGLVAAELFEALLRLARPSWGAWNGLLIALARARLAALRGGGAAVTARLEQARVLGAILDRLGGPADPALADVLRPLAKLLRGQPLPSRPRLGDLYALPITLRNDIVHFDPEHPAWWSRAALALRPWVEYCAAHPGRPDVAGAEAYRPPWFLDDGRGGALNGLDDRTAVYVTPDGERRPAPEQLPAALAALNRLFGREELQQGRLKRLADAVPDGLAGILLGDCLLYGPPVGDGGFALVFRGTQISTQRRVAVKVLRDGLGAEERARFQQEAALLARFDHPHIVGVFGHGEEPWFAPREPALAQKLAHEDWFIRHFKGGGPKKAFIVLEWVEGHTLEQVYQGGRTPAPTSAELTRWFADAAGALAAVHEHKLLHRDVKPGNLMVTPQGRVVLMDFGIARRQDELRTLHTATGQVLGTLPYMAPEQFRSADARQEVGPAADVYSLCAAFYELCTHSRLFDHDRSPQDAVLRKLNTAGPEPARSRVPGLAWEIDVILGGGLQREPADRYKSAAELEGDLRSVLADRPIRYRRPGPGRRARLFYRRNRSLVRLAAAALLLLGLVSGAAFALVRSAQQETESESAGRKEQEKKAEEKTAEARVREHHERHQRYVSTVRDAADLWQRNRLDELLEKLRQDERPPDDYDPRGFEWYYWWRMAHQQPRHTFASAGSPWRQVKFDAEGKRLAAVAADGTVKMWDVATGRELLTLPEKTTSLVFSPDKKLFATDKTFWDAATGRSLNAREGKGRCFAFSPDGKRLAAASSILGSLCIYDVPSWQQVASLAFGDRMGGSAWDVVLDAAFSPDGNYLAGGRADGTIDLWDVGAPRPSHLRSVKHTGPAISVAFTPNSKTVAGLSAGTKNLGSQVESPVVLTFWDFSGKEIVSLPVHAHAIDATASSGSSPIEFPGDFRVAFRRAREEVLYGGEVFNPLGNLAVKDNGRPGDDQVWWLYCTGDRAVQVCYPHQVGLDLESTVFRAQGAGRVISVAVAPDGSAVACATREDGAVRLWDAARDREFAVVARHFMRLTNLGVSPDGSRLMVTCFPTGGARVWDLGADPAQRKWRPDSPPGDVAPREAPPLPSAVKLSDLHTWAFSPDRRWLATSSARPSGKGDGTLKALPIPGIGARAAGESTLQLWPLGQKDTEPVLVTTHAAPLRWLVFSPDGSQLAAGGDDGTVLVCTVATHQVRFRRRGHGREVIGLAFHPGGRRLASASGMWRVPTGQGPGEVILWDVTPPGDQPAAAGEPLLKLGVGPKRLCSGVAFSPDGRRLYALVNPLPVARGGLHMSVGPGEIVVWEMGAPQ